MDHPPPNLHLIREELFVDKTVGLLYHETVFGMPMNICGPCYGIFILK